MPIYDYDCAACGRRSEIVHGVHADPPATCPLCGGGPLRKAVSAPAIHFKGTGWAKKERRTAPAKAGASSGAAGEGSAAGESSGDHKDGASGKAESGSGSKGSAGSDAGASTATKPAVD